MAFTVTKQTATWLLIFTIVAIVLGAIQIIRVNSPKATETSVERRVYTPQGRVLPERIEVGAKSFYSHKLDLNRRMKLTGSFRTPTLKQTVSVLIVRENDFENWKNGAEVSTVVKTGYIPGGKLSPVLEPGVYYLIIDNRNTDQPQSVSNDFTIE